MSNWFSPFGGCGCWWSTKRVCGDFVEPVNPDKGQCHPYRVKLDCEAPVLPYPGPIGPVDSCGQVIVYIDEPDLTPPLRILSNLNDESCQGITDESGDQITTNLV